MSKKVKKVELSQKAIDLINVGALTREKIALIAKGKVTYSPKIGRLLKQLDKKIKKIS
jgi:hypothetical protein